MKRMKMTAAALVAACGLGACSHDNDHRRTMSEDSTRSDYYASNGSTQDQYGRTINQQDRSVYYDRSGADGSRYDRSVALNQYGNNGGGVRFDSNGVDINHPAPDYSRERNYGFAGNYNGSGEASYAQRRMDQDRYAYGNDMGAYGHRLDGREVTPAGIDTPPSWNDDNYAAGQDYRNRSDWERNNLNDQRPNDQRAANDNWNSQQRQQYQSTYQNQNSTTYQHSQASSDWQQPQQNRQYSNQQYSNQQYSNQQNQNQEVRPADAPQRSGDMYSSNPDQQPAAMDQNIDPDKRILSILHAKDVEEVEIGRLAQQKGQAKSVKNFGDELVKDHSAHDDKVQAVAKGANIALMDPQQVKWMCQREKGIKDNTPPKDPVAELKALDGVAFDQAFSQKMKEGHQELIRIVEDARTKVKNEDVKKLLDKTLPTLREHQKMAEHAMDKTDNEKSDSDNTKSNTDGK